MKIHLGPAGSPATSTLEGLSTVSKLGLQAMEVQFTHGIAMGLPLAKQIGEENKNHNIILSVHAPYYINLASEDNSKITASKKRIIASCERANLMGAERVVFHAAYYGKHSKEETYDIVKEAMLEMMGIIEKNNWNVQLAPETTGRVSQFGTLDEIIKLVREIDCSFCLDSAHIYARANGKIDYDGVFKKLEFWKKMLHCHFSGIAFTEKGERNHLNLDSKPDFKDFAKHVLASKRETTVISETPITWRDSLKMKKIFEHLGYSLR
jgi:deoxyribonuclease-4